MGAVGVEGAAAVGPLAIHKLQEQPKVRRSAFLGDVCSTGVNPPEATEGCLAAVSRQTEEGMVCGHDRELRGDQISRFSNLLINTLAGGMLNRAHRNLFEPIG